LHFCPLAETASRLPADRTSIRNRAGRVLAREASKPRHQAIEYHNLQDFAADSLQMQQ
jgi:hypothetical protein